MIPEEYIVKRSLHSCLVLISICCVAFAPSLGAADNTLTRMSLITILIYFFFFSPYRGHADAKIAKSFNSWLLKYQTNLDTHFCLYIMIQKKGLFTSCINQEEVEKYYKKVMYELNTYFGKANVQRTGFDSFAAIREFPSSITGNQIEKADYQSIVTRTISDRLQRILEIPEVNSPEQFTLTIGCAASGIRYQLEKVEQMIDLACFTAGRAKAEQKPYRVADEVVRAQKLDIDECKQGFLATEWEAEFNPFFQPIIDPESFEVIGVECLGRWQLGGFRIIPANVFKDVAQELRHITKIDLVIIEKAFSNVRSLILSKLVPYTFKVVVNVSDESLTAHFLEHLKTLIKQYGLHASQIEIDIKDTALSNKKTAAVLQDFRQEGFRVSLDVFNETSFDLFSFMNTEFDTLKLDFANFSPPLQFVYTALKETAQSLGVEVLAKGIESKETLDTALALGCHYLQGNYFTPPIPKPMLEIFMNKYQQGLYLNSSLG